MNKSFFMIVSLIALCCLLFSDILSGGENAVQEIQLQFDDKTNTARSPEFLLPNKGKDFPAAKCYFQADTNGLTMNVFADVSEKVLQDVTKDELFIFLKGSPDNNQNAYLHMFGYTMIPESFHTDLYYISSNGVICPHTPGITVSNVSQTEKRRHLQVHIPWDDMAHILPFEKGEGTKKWFFTIARTIDSDEWIFQGVKHSPKTWAVLTFPDFPEAYQKQVYVNIIKRFADEEPLYEESLCSKESYLKCRTAKMEMMKSLSASVKGDETAAVLRDLMKKSRAVHDVQTYIASSPVVHEGEEKSISVGEEKQSLYGSYKICQDYENVWLVHGYANKNTILYVRNGFNLCRIPVIAGKPFNIYLGHCSKNSYLEIYELNSNKQSGNLKIESVLVNLASRLEPPVPANLWHTAPADHQAGCGSDGHPHPHMINISRAYSTRFKAAGVKTVFLGDSITQYFTAPAWNRLSVIHAGNAGIEGDTVQGTMWRMDQTDLPSAAPDVFVILIGTNNITAKDSEEAIAGGILDMVHTLHKRCPDSKILILGLLPRSAKWNVSVKKINNILSKFADDKTVFYKDFGYAFLKEDGTIDPKLMPDSLHPSQAGYNRFLDDFLPYFRHQFLPASNEK